MIGSCLIFFELFVHQIAAARFSCSDSYVQDETNAVTVNRITKNFVMKTDTVALIKCKGSQAGPMIRADVKEVLSSKAGWDCTWNVNWVTDNEIKQISARASGRHEEVGLETNHTGDCVDHSIELVCEESIAETLDMKSQSKCRRFVDYMKDSSLAKEFFHNLMVEAGAKPLAVIQGTNNW